MDGSEVKLPPVPFNMPLLQFVAVDDIVPDEGILHAVGYSGDWVDEILNDVQPSNIYWQQLYAKVVAGNSGAVVKFLQPLNI